MYSDIGVSCPVTRGRSRNRPRKGSYVELFEDVNCIPAGVYKLLDVRKGWCHFRIGSRVEFAISGLNQVRHRFIEPEQASGKRTRVKAFAKRYYNLLEEQDPTLRLDHAKPVTVCALDPALIATYKSKKRKHKPRPTIH